MWWNVPAQTCAACGPISVSSRPTISRGRASREGDEQDRLGGYPPGDQVGDAVGDHPSLARPGPGQDQVVAVGGGRRRALRLVQVLGEPRGEPVIARLLQSDLPHAWGPSRSADLEFRGG